MECVVLAAGEGKRMRPLTVKRPKVMLPLANRPMMEHLVLATRVAGIKDFIFVVGYGEREIRRYFGDGSEFGINVTYVTQHRQHGTADAVRSVKGLVTEPFLLMNGDMILKSEDIADFCKCKTPCMGISTTDHPEDYGVVLVEGDRVTSLEEKSKQPKSNLINAGAYLFSTDIFDRVDMVRPSARGELELTDALGGLITERKLGSYRLSYWMDIGHPWDMLDANATLLHQINGGNTGTIEDGVTIHGSVVLNTGSIIRAGSYIEGPCMIGKNCRIGPHAYIRGSTSIGDDCHIGHCTEIKNSIIMP
jgi:UDP-N-acetylglucosamine diphosphorylase/glucosamine-1-phosphate N-acetyltransferase